MTERKPANQSAAAKRAIAEAEARRKVAKQKSHGAEATEGSEKLVKERGGRKGPDPVRFGDWEKNGIASDF